MQHCGTLANTYGKEKEKNARPYQDQEENLSTLCKKTCASP